MADSHFSILHEGLTIQNADGSSSEVISFNNLVGLSFPNQLTLKEGETCYSNIKVNNVWNVIDFNNEGDSNVRYIEKIRDVNDKIEYIFEFKSDGNLIKIEIGAIISGSVKKIINLEENYIKSRKIIIEKNKESFKLKNRIPHLFSNLYLDNQPGKNYPYDDINAFPIPFTLYEIENSDESNCYKECCFQLDLLLFDDELYLLYLLDSESKIYIENNEDGESFTNQEIAKLINQLYTANLLVSPREDVTPLVFNTNKYMNIKIKQTSDNGSQETPFSTIKNIIDKQLGTLDLDMVKNDYQKHVNYYFFLERFFFLTHNKDQRLRPPAEISYIDNYSKMFCLYLYFNYKMKHSFNISSHLLDIKSNADQNPFVGIIDGITSDNKELHSFYIRFTTIMQPSHELDIFLVIKPSRQTWLIMPRGDSDAIRTRKLSDTEDLGFDHQKLFKYLTKPELISKITDTSGLDEIAAAIKIDKPPSSAETSPTTSTESLPTKIPSSSRVTEYVREKVILMRKLLTTYQESGCTLTDLITNRHRIFDNIGPGVSVRGGKHTQKKTGRRIKSVKRGGQPTGNSNDDLKKKLLARPPINELKEKGIYFPTFKENAYEVSKKLNARPSREELEARGIHSDNPLKVSNTSDTLLRQIIVRPSIKDLQARGIYKFKKVSENRKPTYPFGQGENYDRELVENYMSTISADGSIILEHRCHYLGYKSRGEMCRERLDHSDYGECIKAGVFPGATDPMSTFFEQCHLYTYITPDNIKASLDMLNDIWSEGEGDGVGGAAAAASGSAARDHSS